MSKQFNLIRIFIGIGVLSSLLAVVALMMRPTPEKIPEATLMYRVGSVEGGMDVGRISQAFGFKPSASWLDAHGSGYVVWRFEVSDVEYSQRRASYFVLLEHRVMKSGLLLYPLESAGGGMTF